MNEYMKIALKEAKKAYSNGEVPIGAVIVKENKVIAKAYNKKEKNNSAIEHAEIIAINKACKKLKNWRLNNCTLYVTVEPCLMCCGAIIQSRISNVVYGVKNENFGAVESKTRSLEKYDIKIISGIYEEECKKIIKTFFCEKRK